MDKNNMRDSRNTIPKKSELSFEKIIIIGMLILFVYLSTMLVTNYFTIKKYTAEKEAVTQKLELTKEEIKELELYIKNATDPKFVEKMARENLKMVRPDEKVYIVMK